MVAMVNHIPAKSRIPVNHFSFGHQGSSCSYEWPIEKYEPESEKRKSEVKEEPVYSKDYGFLAYCSI